MDTIMVACCLYCVTQLNFPEAIEKSCYDQSCSVKTVGQWPDSFLWTLTMTHKHAKKNILVNISHQISCFVNNPHTITLHNCLEL